MNRHVLERASALVSAAALAVACGGSSSASLGSENDASSDASNGVDTGIGADGSGGMDSGACPGCVDSGGTDGALGEAGDSGGSGDSGGPGDSGGDAPTDASRPCPIVGGAYSIMLIDNAGCGNFNSNAPQCIVQTACTISFSSVVSAGFPAINGDPTLQNDGSFTFGALKEGNVNRTGCTGTWTAGTSTMTVDCGGMGSSQSCVVALTRTNTKCN